MTYRGAFVVCASFLAASLAASRTNASTSALLYRNPSTGRWVKMAVGGDAKGFGAFAASNIKSFSSRAKAPIVTACGKTLAVFSVETDAPPPNTAIVMYDATTRTSFDVAVEGALAPAALGGTYGSFKGVYPVVTILGGSCVAHVVFPANGAAASGIVERAYTVPGLVASPATVLVKEGDALPTDWTPPGTLFGVFPATLPVAVATDSSTDLDVAFRGQATGGGVTSTQDTAVFVYSAQAAPHIHTMAREGEPLCAPNWAGAGPILDDFPPTLPVGINAAIFGPWTAFREKTKGGPSTTDTAIVEYGFFSGCTAPTVAALEGDQTPDLGGGKHGTYGDFPSTTPLTYSRTGAAFLASITGPNGAVSRGLFSGPNLGAATTKVLLSGDSGTALGSGLVTLSVDPTPAINSAGSPSIVFSASVKGYSPTPLFFWNSATATAAQLCTFGGRNAQIDASGNMTVRVP